MLKEKSIGKFTYLDNSKGIIGNDTILYTFSVFNVDYNKPIATVGIRIKNTSLLPPTDDDENLRALSIVNSDGTIFATNATANNREAVRLVTEKLPDDMNTGEVVRIGSYFAITCHSVENGWRYISIVEEKEYTSYLREMRTNSILIILLFVIVGLAVAVAVTVKNHKPIRVIERKLKKLSYKKSDNHAVDEIKYINDVIESIIAENENYDKKSKVQGGIVRDAILSKILKGEQFVNSSAEEMLYSIGVRFNHDYFTVMTFYFSDLSDAFFDSEMDDTVNTENYMLAKLVVANVLTDLFKTDDMCLFCNFNGMLSCIVNSRGEEIADELIDIVKVAQTLIADNFNIHFTTAISLVHEGLEGVAVGYDETLECLEYACIDNSGIIRYTSAIAGKEGTYYYPVDKEFQMISALRRGDEQTAIGLLKEISDNNRDISMCMFKCLAYEFIGMLIRVANEINEKSSKIVLNQNEIYDDINNCSNLIEMNAAVSKLFGVICSRNRELNDETSEKTSKTIESIKEYISKNYADSDLSGSMIAEKFELNNAYLSTAFKKYTSCGLLEYITNIRINHAIKLIKDTDMPLDKIAVEVGYTNTRTFSRAFTKVTGIAPGKARKK